MRTLVLLCALAGCGSSISCPSSPPLNSDRCDDGLSCSWGDVNCSCSNGQWYCSDCPWQFPPLGIFQCQRSCHEDTWEWSIDCSCDDQQRGICCGSDSLNTCPQQPKAGDPCCNGFKAHLQCPAPSGQMCTCDAGGHWTCP